MSKDLFYKMREQEVAHLLTELEEGNETALITYANLKKCKDLFDEAIKQVEDLAIQEADGYAEKSFSEFGFIFEKRNGSTRFSYSHIPGVIKLKDEIKEIEQISKQAYLASQKGMLVADENGEPIELPKVTYTKDVLIVKE